MDTGFRHDEEVASGMHVTEVNWPAVRAYNRLIAPHIPDAEAFAAADRMFDAGEFGHGDPLEDLAARYVHIIARRFHISPPWFERMLELAANYEGDRFVRAISTRSN